MRCGRCGNENAEANRFCGMCGTPLIMTTPAPNQASVGNPAKPRPQATPVPPPATASVAAGLGDAPVERRPTEPSARDAARSPGPVITGQSFLGLSSPGPYVEPHPERDPLRPSFSLDYLLEDEEEPKRGSGKLIWVLVALVLALGFGYLHWKQGGFAWLNVEAKKPPAVQQAPDAVPSPESGSTAGAATPAGASDPGTAPAGAGSGTSAVETTAGQTPPSQTPSQAVATPVASQPAAAQTTPAQVAPAQTGAAQNQAADPNLPMGTSAQTAGPDPNQPSTSAAVPAETKAMARKPSPARSIVAKPVDPVTEAERYIYGRGVQQDCDRGLYLLKPAAEHSNSKAMISLGTLYSTGTCTPRDLPTAYRWFALALHKEPDNQALQDDLQKLWSQMTQPERQLAIKLSQ